MAKTIQLAPDLRLPLDTVVQRKTIVAKNRVGKSNTGCVYVEEVHKAGVQTIIIDPKGDWYGIRSSADGKGEGLPFLVMGGDHGDVPLEPSAGKVLGDYLGSNHVDVVLDVSDFSKGELARFGADFFEALYVARKKNRTPLDLVVEEAEDFAPQQIFDRTSSIEQSRCLGALIKIAKKAGFLGIGLLLIAQRTASLNKNVLSQSDGLIIMRTTAPQDLKAIDAWLENQSDEEREHVKKTIQTLPTGTAIVWFPELGLFKQVQVRRRETFDAGFTPKVGETKTEPKVKAKVDLERLMGSLKDVVERARTDDPETLKARIRELEKQVKAQKPIVETIHDEVVIEKPVPFVPEEIQKFLARLADEAPILSRLSADLRILPEFRPKPRPAKQEVAVPLPARFKPKTVVQAEGVSGPQQRILDALAWLESIGIQRADRVQLALLADASPSSSAYANNLGTLRSNGFIDYPAGGVVALTKQGQKAANAPARPPTVEDLHRTLREKLSAPQWRILECLIEVYPRQLAKDDLAGAAEASLTSSAYANNLGTLRSLGLIDYPERGHVVAKPVLFLEA